MQAALAECEAGVAERLQLEAKQAALDRTVKGG